MKCEECDRKATVYFSRENAEGAIEKTCFCDSCAEAKGVTDPESFMMMEMLEALKNKTPESPLDDLFDVEDPEDEALACPACGFTKEAFQKIGRFGCPECYRTFGAELEDRLKLLHRGTAHTGRVPAGSASRRAVDLQNLSEMREQLATAVREENFEEAARLKKEIERLQTDRKEVNQEGGKN